MKPRLVGRFVLAGAVALAAFVSLSAASASVSSGRATAPLLVEGLPYHVSSLDPTNNTAEYLDALGLELLMKLSPTGQVEPSLAQSVTQPSPATYVYHLRHGVKFWDGSEMTADDVANSINYQRYPGFTTSSNYGDVKSVKAADRYTVVVVLKRPDAGWPYVFTYTGYIFEKKFQDEHKTTMGHPGVLIMGTGPYEFNSLDTTSGAELSANPHYWGGKPAIQHISVKFFSDEQSMALAFRAGEIDIAFPGDPRAWATTAGAKPISVPSAEQGFFSMNTQVAPWNDTHVRRAVAYALNRVDIIAAAGGGATPDYTMIPPVQLRAIASRAQVDALLKSLPLYPFNLAKAKQEMAKSAYPNGFSTKLDILQYSTFPIVAQAIAGDLKPIGINVQVNSLPGSTWSAEFQTGFGIQYTYFYSQSPDPGFVPGIALDSKDARPGGVNFARYTNLAADKLIDAGTATTNPAKRFALYSKLLKIVANDAPYVALYEGNNNLAISNKFMFPTFNAYTTDHTPWILNIKPR